MPFNSNFDSPAQLTAAGVVVKGSSSELENGELVSRSVAIEQGGNLAHGPASSGARWATGPLAGFSAGEAVVLGSETYLVRGGQPSFATFTWAQTVTLAEE